MPAVSLPLACRDCGVVLDASCLSVTAYVCACGRHFPMHAEAWIGLLADQSTWCERWCRLSPPDVPEWSRPKPYREQLEEAAGGGLNEAVRVGTGEIGGRPAWLAVFDFRFVGGSLSVVAGERLVRAFEQAVQDRLPVVLVTASGGARMQEGPLALMQMARVNGAVAGLHDAGLPFISVLSHPTYGGTAASVALLADVNIAEPGAAIGFTGPRVIEQATHERLPSDFQTAEFQLRRGQVDMIVARTELRTALATLYDLFVP